MPKAGGGGARGHPARHVHSCPGTLLDYVCTQGSGTSLLWDRVRCACLQCITRTVHSQNYLMHLNLAIFTALRLLVIIRKLFYSPNLRRDYPMFSSSAFTSFSFHQPKSTIYAPGVVRFLGLDRCIRTWTQIPVSQSRFTAARTSVLRLSTAAPAPGNHSAFPVSVVPPFPECRAAASLQCGALSHWHPSLSMHPSSLHVSL